MSTLLNLLAVAGGAAAAWHVVRAAFHFLRGGMLGIWADEMGHTHARHGDLTSMEDRARDRDAALRDSRRSGLEALGWLALLAAPTVTPWPRSIYAAYVLLWAGPALRRARRSRGGPGAGGDA